MCNNESPDDRSSITKPRASRTSRASHCYLANRCSGFRASTTEIANPKSEAGIHEIKTQKTSPLASEIAIAMDNQVIITNIDRNENAPSLREFAIRSLG